MAKSQKLFSFFTADYADFDDINTEPQASRKEAKVPLLISQIEYLRHLRF
jgi:hypothetical protein